MKKFSFILLLSIFALTGCVTGTRNIDLVIPDHAGSKKASGDIYIADITDKRVFEQKPSDPSTPSVKGDLATTSPEKLATLIGRQRNGYGGAMGDVALPEGETIMDKMRALLAKGLSSRGYNVVDDENAPNKITVDVDKFWAWGTPGMWVISFESILQSKLDIVDSSGQSVGIDVKGYGINKGQVASDANWKLAYTRAYLDFLKNLDTALDEKGL